MTMCELLKKYMMKFLYMKKDIVNRNKNVDKTVKEWLKPYQKILSDHDYNEFSEMIFSVVSMAEQTGFEME